MIKTEVTKSQQDPSRGYPPETRAIFMTNINGSGGDVMVFTSLTAEDLTRAYRNAPQRITWDEVSEVPDQDVGYYLYEPCWLTLAEETQARKLCNPPRPPTQPARSTAGT